ncbi:hypothetical protein HG536_0H04120 [Torulaspora globosa]|uniref:CBM21 domain-containing protein n=1 Tax=Torulaspora globosa TaxID=48254 RepID=A0A7G3ZNF0_9SACH|nr:uncharacterized protein HG536_0H04120 [Torulaspora globosa]QLL35036.1 hypothetical protein HG536_0H04120 [Torulaspora globosa]
MVIARGYVDTKINSVEQSPAVLKLPTRSPMIRRLKSSMKLSKSHSTPSVTTTSSSSSSQKNVRFAAELTTVKKFDSSAEPISISNENSPKFYPISDSDLQYNLGYPETLYGNADDCCVAEDGFWFNESSLVPTLRGLNDVKRLKRINRKSLAGSKFQLDYDSDSGIDDDDEFDDDVFEETHEWPRQVTGNGLSSDSKLEVIDWRLTKTNISPMRPVWNPFLLASNQKAGENDLESQIFDYLQGSNIRLHSLKQSTTEFGKIIGLIYVNNLNFEKFIEIKLTFNRWKDMHYIPANFSRSITDKIDEFRFVIDLNSLKYSLQVKNLIYAMPDSTTSVCRLNVELCCRYDVNNETFYDNNNYENYQIQLAATVRNTAAQVTPSTVKENPSSNIHDTNPSQTNSFARDFLVSTTLTHNPNLKKSSIGSRQFSEDTDYYNTSPLKHLYHNDTSLIKPVRMNQVLMNPELSTDEEDYATPDINEISSKGLILSSKPIESHNSSSSFSSSSSGGYSPLEDFASMASSDYRPYPSIDSMSSIEMANYNYHLPVFNTLHSYSENHDDGQSIVTDIPGDHNNTINNNSNSNNSTDTLINPDAIPRPLSSVSAEPVSFTNSHQYEGSDIIASSDSKSNTLEATSGLKDQDYQAFLSSYCFHTSPTSKGLDPRFENPLGSKTFFAAQMSQPVPVPPSDQMSCERDTNDHTMGLETLSTPPPVLSQASFEGVSRS